MITAEGSTTTAYIYDCQTKTVGSSTTTYYYADGTLLGEYNPTTGRQLIYLYDESGSMYGLLNIIVGDFILYTK